MALALNTPIVPVVPVLPSTLIASPPPNTPWFGAAIVVVSMLNVPIGGNTFDGFMDCRGAGGWYLVLFPRHLRVMLGQKGSWYWKVNFSLPDKLPFRKPLAMNPMVPLHDSIRTTDARTGTGPFQRLLWLQESSMRIEKFDYDCSRIVLIGCTRYW
uniref:Uncharacterized protein n=1 Tax=Anopheles culicifacies TaxID=139723 RepID=A0A182M5Z6_9DIPT